ncbi:MAG: serine hydrolase [Bacteroidota bacterium]
MRFLPLLLLLGWAGLSAQTYTPAKAFPIAGLTIDGKLDDWPEKLPTYPITNLAFGTVNGPDDLSASFQIGYDAAKNDLYLGLTVHDSEPISQDPDGVLDNIDNVLLYLDGTHHPAGGACQLFLAGGDLRDVGSKRDPVWDPYRKASTWDDIQLAIRTEGGQTTYEWQIHLHYDLRPAAVLGLDLIVADRDPDDEGASWLTWKPGTGKSRGTQLLGEVLLVDDTVQLGTLSGKVATAEARLNSPGFVRVQSRSDPTFWLRLPVDSLGNYQGRLPAGDYTIASANLLSWLPAEEGSFSHPIRIEALAPVYATVTDGQLTVPATLEIAAVPPPGRLFTEKGALFLPELPEQRIDHFVRSFQEYLAVPGVSIALIQDGKVVYDKHFGVKNELTGEPLERDNLFEAASISKPTFAMMVLKLVEEGRLDLDRPLYEYLRFPNLEHDERYKLLTARHVLNHQSGIDNWVIGTYSGVMTDAPVNLNFTPGTAFGYSGEAFNYLGRVVEKIIGKSLSAYFAEELAPAMGMTTTRFAYTDELAGQIALGHGGHHPNYKDKYSGVDSPASGVITNAHDFANFLTGVLAGKYLSPESYQLISTPHQVLTPAQRFYDKEAEQSLAHGFFLTDLPQGRVVAHGGNNGDYKCKFGLIPERKLGYVVFTNSSNGDEFHRLLELFLLYGEAAYRAEYKHH